MLHTIKVTFFCNRLETGKQKQIKKSYLLGTPLGESAKITDDLMTTLSDLQNKSSELRKFLDVDGDPAFEKFEVYDTSIDLIKVEDDIELRAISKVRPDSNIYKVSSEEEKITFDKSGEAKVKTVKTTEYVLAETFKDVADFDYPGDGLLTSINKVNIHRFVQV